MTETETGKSFIHDDQGVSTVEKTRNENVFIKKKKHSTSTQKFALCFKSTKIVIGY